FTEYRGEYSFKEEDSKTQVSLAIDYQFDIPLIGKMMQKVILKLMQENCEANVKALKDEAERQVKIQSTSINANES
ncbi:MAG: hypothetical protein JOZ57_11885, partial [Abitibacteriaceae bacterium]|nr:hypothetical protein [Abditibacteriaceae bacterium]